MAHKGTKEMHDPKAGIIFLFFNNVHTIAFIKVMGTIWPLLSNIYIKP